MKKEIVIRISFIVFYSNYTAYACIVLMFLRNAVVEKQDT